VFIGKVARGLASRLRLKLIDYAQSRTMCFDVARGLASRLRLKLIIGDDIGTIKRSRQGIGFASAIETHITQEVYIQARNGVARGLASRLRLKHKAGEMYVPDEEKSPGDWLRVCD